MHRIFARLRALFHRPLTCACGQPALCTDEARRPLCAACGIKRYART